MVEVIDTQSARDGIIVLPATVLEYGVEGEDREFLLHLRLNGFILVLGKFPIAALLQGIFYLGTDSGHARRIEHSVEKFGGTFPNLASYIFSYSKTHRCDV